MFNNDVLPFNKLPWFPISFEHEKPKGQRISFLAIYFCPQEVVIYILRKGNGRTSIDLVLENVKFCPFKAISSLSFVSLPQRYFNLRALRSSK